MDQFFNIFFKFYCFLEIFDYEQPKSAANLNTKHTAAS